MTYRNKKTGRVVVVTSEVIGEEWEKIIKGNKPRAEKPKPTERKAKGKATS